MAIKNWGGSIGAWETAANWIPLGVPVLGDDAILAAGFATLSTTITVNSIALSGATLDIKNPGGTETLTGGLTITGVGRLSLDANYIGGQGGNSLIIGGLLTNDGTDINALNIGNIGITSADTVTASGLVNNGHINIAGSVAAQSTLNVTSVAGFGTAGVETGSVYLQRNALLQFASGQIATINGQLFLDGANARIAVAGATTTNSALVGLQAVVGDLQLLNGASVGATSGGLSILGTGRIGLDANYVGGAGGSSLTIGGVLTNTSTDVNALNIGNSGITSANTVTATGLANTGRINIVGGAAAQSTLNITNAAGFGTAGVETGAVYLENNALLQFAGGQIGTINGSVWLNGANARIANSNSPSTNSTMLGLKTIAGDLILENGASVTPNGGLSIIGTGRVALDAPYIGGQGGSTLTIAGILTNASTDANGLSIGSSGITSGVTVTASELANTGQINLIGSSTAQATLRVTAGVASFGTAREQTGFVHLQGNALLEFPSESIQTVKGTLWIEGKNARVADAGAPSTNSALVELTTVSGTFALGDGASVGKTVGDLSITGTGRVALDAPYLGGAGGSTLTIGGRLHNTSKDGNALDIGNASIKSADTVSALFLENTGRINIVGSGAAQATLDITKGAASMGTAGVATGFVYLENNALLQFASGQLGTVAGTLWLNGQNARVADVAAPSTNSALIDLATVSGSFNLQNGASVGTTSDGLTITGTGRVALDANYLGGNGGSTLKIGGTLTNTSTDVNALNIGNVSIKADTTVTAMRLANSGQINIMGSATAQAALIVDSTAGFGTDGIETGTVYLQNNALLQFAASQIDTIKGTLWLDGKNARVADASAPSSNSALNELFLVTGSFNLQNGATVGQLSTGLTISGTGRVAVDANYIGGAGGSLLSIGGSLVNNSTDVNGLNIGNVFIGQNVAVTALALANSGTIQLTGSGTHGATLKVTNFIQNSGVILVNGGGVLEDGDTLTSTGALKLAGGTIDSATVTLTGAGTLTGSGIIDGSITNNGYLEATDGVLVVTGSIGGTGLVKIGSNATLELGAGSPDAVFFNGASATLRLDTPAAFKGTIVGFDALDKIDLRGVAGGTKATLDSKNVLHVLDAGSVEITSLQLTASNIGQSFTVGSDGAGGTMITGGGITPGATVHNGVFQLFGPSNYDYTSMFPALALATSASLADIGGGRQKYVVSYSNGIQVEFDGTGLKLGASGQFAPSAGNVDTVIVSAITVGQPIKIASFTSDAANGHAMLEPFAPTILTGGASYYHRLLDGDNRIIGSNNDDFIVDNKGINTIDGGGGYNSLYFGPAVTQLHVTSGTLATDPLGVGSATFVDDWGSDSWKGIQNIFTPPVANQLGDISSVNDYNNHNRPGGDSSDNRTPNDGGGTGEPHFTTFDGTYYDFQGVGEFVLAKSTVPGDTFEVQIRTAPYFGSSTVTAMSEVAVKIGNQRVTFDQGRPDLVWVDGSPVSLVNNTFALTAGHIDLVSPGRYNVVDDTGRTVHVLAWSGAYFDVRVSLGANALPSTVQGLLGDNDGLGANDFALKDGTVLPMPLSAGQLYGAFADAWRVAQATSLLDYGAGQTTNSFTNKAFPQNAVTLADLPQDAVARATVLAVQAGITNTGLLQQAAFDFVATGNLDLITLAANQQQLGVQTTAVAQLSGSPSGIALAGISAVAPEVVESQGTSTSVSFEIYRTGDTSSSLTVTYAVAAPGAGYFKAADFGGTLPTGQVTLLAGQNSATITIGIPNVAITAASEALRVQITNAGGLAVFGGTADVDVANNTPVAGSHASPAFEKLLGSGVLNHVGNAWTLDLGAFVQGQQIEGVLLAVANLVASPGNSLSGSFGVAGNGFTLTGASAFTGLAAGAEKALSLGIDTSILGARSLTLTLHSTESNDTGFSAALADQTLVISSTILAAGTAQVSIASASADKAEGNGGTTPFTFTVTRSGDTSGPHSVSWSIVGSGANGAGLSDFAAGALNGGTLSFTAGETSKTVSILVTGDTEVEPDEQFTVSLQNPTAGLTIGTGSAIGTIRNDDGLGATVSISASASVKGEGNSGTTPFTFTVSRTGSTSAGATVDYAVTGSATNPANAADFVGNAVPVGTVTFAIGEATKTLAINVAGDATVETDNGFIVALSNPSAGLTLGSSTANGTILNDDLKSHDDAYIILQGKSLTAAAATGVLGNDETTPPVTAALQVGAGHGQLQLAADGSLSYTPTSNFAGIDSFSYHAAGANGAGDDGQALIYVVPVLVGTTTTLDLLGLNAEEQIASTYAAFFGRGADREGFAFWVNQFNINLPTQGGAALFANIASSFGVSAEAKALYPFLINPFGSSDAQIGAFIDSVYNNLFNRGSDAAGLAYWTGQVKATLAAGQFVGSVLINIMSGAQDTADGHDITTLMGKVAVGLEYVHEQQSHNTQWAGASDTAAATALLRAVTDSAQTVLTGMKNADLLIANHA
ncbi:MAG: VWD domain-containing protein [Reyranellaceae bacterium]